MSGSAAISSRSVLLMPVFRSLPVTDTISVPAPGRGENVVEISGGTVSVTEASCKNQVCVRHGAISKTGESIVCLPNRLVVRIQSGSAEEGGGYDSVTS